jgi:hypothetical protein
MTSWYSISISLGVDQVFDGYFSVDNATSLVTGFYDKSLPNGGFYTNVILPTNDAEAYFGANNIYPFDEDGLNFYSTAIQNNLGDTSSNHFNIYDNNNGDLILYQSGGNITIYNIVVTQTENPISNICFPAGTPITTNQGQIPIEKINPKIHTIRNKKIVGITATISLDKYLVCFEKNSLGPNVPSQKTIISKYHCILYKGEMIQAKEFIGQFENIKKIKYNGEILYNVLMEEHDKMIVNNLICETLHPENGTAKLYKTLQALNPQEQETLIKKVNNLIKNKPITCKK